MKLVVVEPTPAHGGGSEAMVLSLARGLAGRGHEIVLVHDQPGSMTADYAAFATDIISTALPGFAFRVPATTMAGVWNLMSTVRRCGAHAGLSSHLGYLRHAALVHRLVRVPFLFHLGLPCVGSTPLLRWSYRNLGFGIAPSAHTAASWEAGGWPRELLGVVPNWVDIERFQPATDVPALRRSLSLEPEARYVLFLGRICEQKGIRVLLRAFADLGPAHEDAVLLLVGGVAPDFADDFEAELGRLPETRRSKVLLRPVTAFPERYYQAADVACVPSLGDEAFGLTVIEAMSCGLPVLTSALGVTPDILGESHADLLRRPGDVAHWTQGLRDLLDNSAHRRRTGISLRDRAVACFGPEPGLDAYEERLIRMTARRRGN
ncbi:glycosyltransferase family 4 protein [Luteimonas vadosa]|uniref:glycosyltransferase family 4 protein n=1 Tax=Luteimonas vadosa TaxID=1165507 RepID=UPI0031EDC4CC